MWDTTASLVGETVLFASCSQTGKGLQHKCVLPALGLSKPKAGRSSHSATVLPGGVAISPLKKCKSVKSLEKNRAVS